MGDKEHISIQFAKQQAEQEVLLHVHPARLRDGTHPLAPLSTPILRK